jgi:hypothetical protein
VRVPPVLSEASRLRARPKGVGGGPGGAAGGEPGAARPEAGSAAAARHRTAWRGIRAAVAAFVVVALVHAWSIPAYAPPDEASHVGYASVLARGGGLPTIDTPIPIDGDETRLRNITPRKAQNKSIWTANHPPLYYALIAVPIGIGNETGHPLAGVRAARMLSIALAAAALLLLGWMLLLVLPARPQLAVAATALVALVPTLPVFSSIVYNDAMSFLAAIATLTASTAFLVRGPSWPRLAAVAAAASAAALTRASGLMVVGVAGLAVLFGVWRAGQGSARARLLRAVGWAAAVGGAVVATAGWFYLRNLSLYDDLTGTSALMERFGRSRHGSTLDSLKAASFWVVQQKRLWDITYNMPQANASAIREAWLPLIGVPLVGLGVAAVRLAWRRARRPWRPGALASGPVVAVVLWFLLLGLMEVSVAQFRAAGGNSHARYIFPGLAALGLTLAAGLAALPGARRGLPALAMLAALAVVNVWGWLVATGLYFDMADGAAAVRPAFAAAGIGEPAAILVPAGLAFAAALGVLGHAVWSLGGGRASRGDREEPSRPPSPEASRPVGAGSAA